MTDQSTDGGSDRVGTALRRSRAITACHSSLGRCERALERVSASSRAMALMERALDVAVGSRLVGWVTHTPRRRVVDATDARTLGPVLPVVVGGVRWLADAWRASAVRRVGHRLAGAVRSAPVRACSALVLVAIALSVAVAWDRATAVGVGGAAILSGLALPGLLDDRPWDEVREGLTGRALHALVAPPSDGTQR